MSPIYVLFILLIYTSVMLNTISKCNLKHMYISAHENFKPCVLFQRNHGNERIYMYSEIITSTLYPNQQFRPSHMTVFTTQVSEGHMSDLWCFPVFYKRELRKIEAFSKKFKYILYCTKFYFLWMLVSRYTMNGVNKTIFCVQLVNVTCMQI